MNLTTRKSNIELLRIVLMTMIITHHVVVHGMGLKGIKNTHFKADNWVVIELLINSFVVIGVNAFIFISGYFGMKFKIKTVISFVLQALFYSVGIYLIMTLLVYKQNIDYNKLGYALFPISKTSWWFLTTYLGLYFLAPFLNKGMKHLDKKEFSYLLLGLLFLDCFSGFIFGAYPKNGYTIFHFITLYVFAGYIKKYVVEIKKPLLLFIIISLILFASALLCWKSGNHMWAWKIFSYNNPVLMVSAGCIFYVFKNINISSKIINTIASCVFGIYLIHDHKMTNKLLERNIMLLKAENLNNELHLAGILMLIILGIFIVGFLVEFIRKMIFDGMIEKWGSEKK